MEVFHADGHLTNEALLILIRTPETAPAGLTRLEMAEHLAFCDDCLRRYMELLEGGPLLVPAHSCRRSLWSRVRARSLRAAVSRYATAAAAVALALTMLWGAPRRELARPVPEEDRPSVSRQLTELTGELGDSLRGTVSGLSVFFDGFRPSRFIEGGNNS